MSFVPLKNLIPQVTKSTISSVSGQALHQSLQHDTGPGVFDLFRAAIKEICGDIVGAQIQPLYINNNILVVACLSQAAGDILRLKEKEIIDKVNEELKGTIIRQLRCVG